MDEFLDSLSPSLRKDVEAVLEKDTDNKIRLTAVVGPYVDDDGNWPTQTSTADYLAKLFLHQVADREEVYTREGLRILAGGALGAGVSIGAAKGAVILQHKLLADYWQQVVTYSTGVNPIYIRVLKMVFDSLTEGTRWEQLAQDLTSTESQWKSSYEILFGSRMRSMIEGELLGVFAEAAWRGARSALVHTGGKIGSKAEVNPWIQNYVKTFAENQATLAQRTMNYVVNSALENGQSVNVLAGRLKQLWNLTPQHARAVDTYRQGLLKQDRTQRSAHQLSQRYANRLLAHRLKTLTDTEVHTAFNLGREAQWIQAVQNGEMPIDTVKMWVTAQDELVCKICRPLDGTTASLGEVFDGTVPLVVPAAHPNCRCILIPVSGGEVADVSQSKQLVMPKQAKVTKHFPGDHDQKEHGSWARRLLTQDEGLSPRVERQLIKELTGKTFEETRDNIIEFLRGRADGTKIEMGVDLTSDNKILGLSLGDHHSTPNVKNAGSVTRHLFHNHPRPSPPSTTDTLKVVLDDSIKSSTVVTPKGVYYTESKREWKKIYPTTREWNEAIDTLWKATEQADALYMRTVYDRLLNAKDSRKKFEWKDSDPFAEKIRREAFFEILDPLLREVDVKTTYKVHDKVSKHLGGHDGKQDHPSGSSQDVHNKGGGGSKVSLDPRDHKALLGFLGVAAGSILAARYLKNPNMLKEAARFKQAQKLKPPAPAPIKPKPSPESQIKSLYDDFEWNGFRTKATNVLEDGSVQGWIYNSDDTFGPVGSFHRQVDFKTKTVHHSFFEIEPAFQGQGFGSAWNKHLFDQYRKMGFEKVELLANMEVGGYAWAKQGFRPRNVQAQGSLVNQILKKPVEVTKWAPEDIAHLDELTQKSYRLIRQIEVARLARDGTALDRLADLGRVVKWDDIMKFSPQAQKDLLLGSSWEGSLNLTKAAVLKHLGGHDGKQDHPSGTPQTIHGSGGGGSPNPVSSFLDSFDIGDGEFSDSEKAAVGVMLAAATALATRGKIRNLVSPTVWTKTAKAADGTPLPSSEMMKAIRSTFETNHNGYRSVVTSTKIGDAPHHSIVMNVFEEQLRESGKFSRAARLFTRRNNIRVEGKILAPNGTQAGKFDVSIDPKTREAFQNGMFMNTSHQGTGFAGAWTSHVGLSYVRTGIRKVGALASSDVGGYAWAQRGFNWRYHAPSIDVVTRVRQAARGEIPNLKYVSPDTMKEIAKIEQRIKTGLATGRFPTPQEIANVGRKNAFLHPQTGKETWAGKEIMMGTQWQASLDLSQIKKILKSEGLLTGLAVAKFLDEVEEIEKFRTVTVREYTRADGTVVPEHERKIKGTGSKDRLFSRLAAPDFSDDLTDTQEQVIAAALIVGAGIATRGLFRQAAPLKLGMWKSYDDVVKWAKANKTYNQGVSQWVSGGSMRFRVFLEGQPAEAPKYHQRWMAFAEGLDNLATKKSPFKLYRGMAVPKATPRGIESFTLTTDKLMKGHTFDMAPSSFTRSWGTAKLFTSSGSAKHGTKKVIMKLDRGSHSARIADVSPMPWEREYLSWGTYQITKVVEKKKYTEVSIRQKKVYSLVDARTKNAKTYKPPPATSFGGKGPRKADEVFESITTAPSPVFLGPSQTGLKHWTTSSPNPTAHQKELLAWLNSF
jgi:SPP1 gp7 family putative phage head morphogenesis protein